MDLLLKTAEIIELTTIGGWSNRARAEIFEKNPDKFPSKAALWFDPLTWAAWFKLNNFLDEYINKLQRKGYSHTNSMFEWKRDGSFFELASFLVADHFTLEDVILVVRPLGTELYNFPQPNIDMVTGVYISPLINKSNNLPFMYEAIRTNNSFSFRGINLGTNPASAEEKVFYYFQWLTGSTYCYYFDSYITDKQYQNLS